jgi:hypothetical protein
MNNQAATAWAHTQAPSLGGASRGGLGSPQPLSRAFGRYLFAVELLLSSLAIGAVERLGARPRWWLPR